MSSQIEGPNPEIAKVLLIEDDPDDALLLREMLAQRGTTRFDLECADRLQAGLERLAKGGTDVLLLDLFLPDSLGLETVHKVHARASDVPIVVLTGLDDEALAIRAVREGAQDYLIKGQADSNLLVRSIRYAIERHRLLTELERARRKQLQLKDQFLSHVSHELRSPLTTIQQFVTIVLDGLAGNLSPEQREYMEVALRNTNQLGVMLGDLLEAARAETGKLTVDLRRTFLPQLIAETLGTFHAHAAAKGVTLSADVPEGLPPTYADSGRVRQILANLIDNGIKFTPENGRVVVKVRISSQDPDFLLVAVSDTGRGISPDHAERIFDRLYQEASAIEGGHRGLGLGLGLYICKELVSRHGGRIWAESQVGHGSTFFFTLPIFSLTGLLAPILTPKNLLTGSVALITVEMSSVGSRPLMKTNKGILREVRDVLKQCILPDKDILLPNLTNTEMEGIFFIAACTDGNGAEVMVERIRAQLANCPDLQKAPFEWATSFTMMDVPVREGDVPSEHIVADFARRIEDMVTRQIPTKEGGLI
jgi:signal transduction histidine kinase